MTFERKKITGPPMQDLLLNLGLRRNDKSKEEDIHFENINFPGEWAIAEMNGDDWIPYHNIPEII